MQKELTTATAILAAMIQMEASCVTALLVSVEMGHFVKVCMCASAIRLYMTYVRRY